MNCCAITKKVGCKFRAISDTLCHIHAKLESKVESKVESIQNIINIFNQNVKGTEIPKEKSHHGSEGHWLEDRMGIKPNGNNKPDLYGYEMKKESGKITLGDFQPTSYLFSKNKETIDKYNGFRLEMTRDQFLMFFGTNASTRKKLNRYSWSGSCCPKKCDVWTEESGQKLYVDDSKNIVISYSFSKDKRATKTKILKTFPLPTQELLRQDSIVIAIWNAEDLARKINNKFNVNGFFICFKNLEKTCYESIKFGSAFDYDIFLKAFKNGEIIFDSGMYQGNNRNYSQFRAKQKSFWSKLLLSY